nr:uncharacterized protein LOC104110925 [Nicotiana tomentosiformis]
METIKREKVDAPESSPVAMMTGPPSGPIIDIDARPIETNAPTNNDISAHWGESDLVEYANSHFRAAIVVTGNSGLSTGAIPSLVSEHQTTSTAFHAVTSYTSTPSASSPLSPPPATATLFPSSATLPTTVATSNPSAAPNHEEGVPPPQSPSDAPGSSDSGSEFSETEEGSKDDDAKDQAGEIIEPSVEPSTTPEDVDTSLPPDSRYAAV